ncbi:MAG TPA: hypothetical protein VE981_15445 [Planctomycetota bacterium]|nr:hypothetical protein [Planctomycetota bacterium]
MKRSLILAAAFACVPAVSAWAQNVGGGGVFPPNEVDQIKVDLAIEKGIKYLKANNASHLATKEQAKRKMSHRELVLFTYVHADVPETDPDFKVLFDDMMKDQLEATYCVALQAMVLEEVERVKYQKRILMCAKFLVDNQGPQGFWSYGSPSIYVDDVAYEMPKRKDVETSGGKDKGGVREFQTPQMNGPKVKPTVKNKVKVKKDRDGEGHDNSNTQYAALGMRACYDSGIILEDKVIDLAIKWLRDCQKKVNGPEEDLIEGGVNGPDKPGAKPGVASGGGATVAGPSMVQRKAMPQGWCYSDHAEHEAYGSMTAGSIGSLAIWDYIKDNDDGMKKRTWKSDKDVHEGLVWLAKNFSVTYNPGPYEHAKMEKDSKNQYLYYMYALERAGMIYGTEIMGTHKWYPEGAKVLIETQAANGSWGAGTVDTCFAILFLKRATRALGVATDSAAQMRAKQGK